jgi:hypothetical protein
MTKPTLDVRNGGSCPLGSENRHRGKLTASVLLVALSAALAGCGADSARAEARPKLRPGSWISNLAGWSW